MKVTVALVVGIFITALARGEDVVPDFWKSPPARSIDQAVIKFNQDAAGTPIGKTQAPLTRDELIAALRFALPSLKDERFIADVRGVLKSGIIPAGDEISYLTGYANYNNSGYDIKAWRISYMMGNSVANGHALPGGLIIIRQKMIAATTAALSDAQEKALLLQALREAQKSQESPP